MSITDELREYALGWDEGNRVRRDLTAIADRIDAEHEREVTMARGEAVTELGHKVVSEYVKLPVDADGEVVRIGDVMVMASHPFGCEDKPLVVDRMELSHGMHGEVWCLALDTDRSCWTQAAVLRHYQPPTVEDVLREFYVLAVRGKEAHAEDVDADVLTEYAAKLRLKEG